MKAKLTKLFTLLTILLFGFGQVWAEDFTISNICTGSYLSPGNIVKVTLASNTSASSGRLDTKSSKTGGFTISSNAPEVYVKSFTFTDSQYSGNKKGTITCENGGTLVVDANGKYTITANANATSVEIKVVASSSGDCKITGLSVIATNGTANNIETLSGFSFSSGTFSFTSKVNGSSVTPTVGLTSQSSSSWSASSSNITAPSSNDSKTITISAISGYHLKYVAFYDSNCRLSLVEKSSTGGTVNGASWTAADDKTTAVTFKNGISTSITITNVFVVTEADATATKHTVTYDLNGGTGTTPTQADVAEGVKFTLHDGVTDITAPTGKEFAGWNDGSTTYSGGVDYTMGTSNVTLTAQWQDPAPKFTVTYVLNGPSGDAPTETDKAAGAVFSLAAAPSWAGHAFDGWLCSADAAVKAAGASYTMTAANTTFTAQWKAAPTVLFHWRYDGSTTTLNSELSATGGTVTLKSTDTNNYSAESASYNANVPDDMKSTGTKGLKTGKSAQYLEIECTVNFEEGDTIAVTAYGNKDGAGITGWKVSSSDGNTGDIATQTPAGNSNSDYQVGKVVIPSTFVAAKKFYLTRAAGTGTGIAAIKVIRPVKYTVNFAAGEGTGTMTAKAYPATAEVTLPECTFTAPASKEFDAWTSSDVTISAGKFTMPANDVTITATWKAETPKYDITYYPGTGGSGSIDPAKKTKDVDFILSSERFTRAGYLQTGWATADGGAKVYDLGATYTENADLDLYPFWTELDTYVASFACDDAAPAGWTFSNDGWADNVATAAYVCKFVENGISTPLQAAAAGKDGTTENDVAFAKDADAVATYDLGITTTVAAINVVLNGGSGSPFDETIELVGADGTTVKQSYVTSLNAGNWNDNTISKTDVVADVRYIRVHGASKWVVMKSFSVSYIETRTKYDVAFAAGTGASGTMPTLHYAEGAGVVLPAATFTPPTDKEFDAWTSSDVTITDGKFTMPASDVTVTATWKDAITRYDVTFETNGGSTIDAQEVEENGHPTAVADPTKANYVFVGWFNNSDLAPEHAVADITALTITDDITLYAKWQLDIRLRQLVFSNGFDAFIKNNEVKAYYMEGTSAPTMVSYQGVNLKDVADAVTIVGNKVRLVGTDDSVIELDLTLEAVTPMSSYDKQIFDGTETYVKTGNEFSTTSGKLGWKFSKNDGDWSRETPGQNRIYFFVGGSADRATFTSGASSRAIKVYVNNELVSSVETTAAAGSTFDIPLPAANAYNMIAIISNQTSGDGSVTDIQLNEHVISTDVSLSSLTVNGTAIDLQDGVYTYNFELPYGTVDAPTVVAVANAAPYATVSAITVDGTTKATFTVTAESSATQDYVVNFSIARFPTITLWDGSTMTAVVANGDPSLNGITWASTGVSVTSFSAKTCDDNGKSYTKALDFGGNTKATRQFSITIPDGNVARISLVCNAKGTGARSISVGTDLAGVIDENAVSSIETADNTNLFAVAFDFFAAGTLFINTTDGFQVHEITIQMAPGYGRSAMLGNGVLGTVCVPNNVAVEDIQGATFYELAGREPEHGKLAFDEITSGELEAGVPYLFQAQGNHIALLYGATHVANPVYKDNGMYGTFSTIVLTELEDIYYFAQKALWSCKGAVDLTIAANRAYVKLSKVNELSSASPAPGRRRILLGVNGENQATGFENIEHGDAPMKVMIEGTLYILRGEKVFDATGRLVK